MSGLSQVSVIAMISGFCSLIIHCSSLLWSSHFILCAFNTTVFKDVVNSHYTLYSSSSQSNISYIIRDKGVFKGGGVQGVQTPPPKFSDFFLKSEGKEIERKRKGCWGGGGTS